MLDHYDCGVRLIGAYFQDISPPQEVAFAFKHVACAREDRSRIINEAEYERSPEVTGRRLYVEAVEEILPRLRKYVVARQDSVGVANLKLFVPAPP